MRKIALSLLLAVAGCVETGEVAPPVPELEGWHLASGKPPTRAEYNAIVASCEAGAIRRSEGLPLDACLAGLGLKRAP